jgi:protein CpxP
MGTDKSIMFLFFFALALVVVPPLFGQDSYGDFERGLNLSARQRAEMEGIKKRYIPEWQSLKEQAIRKRLELQDLRRNPSGNGSKQGRLEDEMQEIGRSRRGLFNQYRSEVNKILDDKQRERFNNFCDGERKRHLNMPRKGYGR